MSKKQNSLVIFMPSIEGGGVEKNLFIISNYLSKSLNNKIFIITCSKEFRNKFDKKIKIISPKIYFKTDIRKLKYFFCLLELIKFLIFIPNCLIFSFQANIYATIISKIFNNKIIIRSNSAPSGWSKNIFKQFIFKKMFKKADKIIVNSLEFQKEFKKKFNLSSKCIYNPLNKSEILKLSNKKKKLNHFDKNKKSLKIINIGRITSQKNQMMLLRSIDLLKKEIKIKLLIVGRGDLKNELLKFIKQKNLENIVKIINFQKNPFPYIRKSDLFVLTSNFEGLPNVLLEASALKKFIISTNCPTGPKEILENGKFGILVKVGDADELSNKIKYFYKNKKKLRKKIDQNYRSLERFDYVSRLKEYKNEITKLLN